MKKIIPEFAFTQEQQNIVSELVSATGLCEGTVKILYSRGVDTVEKIVRFMNPSKNNFLSPFLMRGMKEAVEMVTLARDEGKTVAVFGDYDADGICAASVMYFALKEFGIDAHIYIPERTDGYGLSEQAIDRVFEDCQPELFITVDCGISCADEVQAIYELGADVIVTDHHELPERLPDCVTVNPKFPDDYPYDNLCGAGVAFKFACALLGESAYKYLDFVALATVADSVPLTGENRDIVTEGLKLFNSSLRPCFANLLGKNHDEVTAQTLVFTIAPRVNAAGRMGDANSAFRLFVSEDEAEIRELSVMLCAYNAERQQKCDELYTVAKKKLNEKGAYDSVVMLANEKWSTGFVGIVAARLVEEFNRPAILFVKKDGMLKGSARSIESINIFNALKNCSEYIEEFGGHAQAAGINVREDKFELLERALNAEIQKNYKAEDFTVNLPVCGEIDAPIDEKFARELSMLEPYGVGHRKPLFYVKAERCSVRPVKDQSPHIAVKNPNVDLMYFSGAKNRKLLESDVEKNIVFELSVSKFRGREYIKGYVKEIVYEGRTGEDVENEVFANELALPEKSELSPTYLTTEEISALVKEKLTYCPYGLCVIASDRRTLDKFPELDGLPCDLFYPASKNLANELLVSPATDVDLTGFREFIFLDRPVGFKGIPNNRSVYVNGEICGYGDVLSLDTDRVALGDIYTALKKSLTELRGATVEEVALNCDLAGFDKKQVVFALKVFSELGLVSIQDGTLLVYRGVKTDLSRSALYGAVQALQAEENK